MGIPRWNNPTLALLLVATLCLPACASSQLRKDQLPSAATLLNHYILVHEEGHAFNPLAQKEGLLSFFGDQRQALSAIDDKPCALRILGTPRTKPHGLDQRVAEHVLDGLETEAQRLIALNDACSDRRDCRQPLRILIFVHGGMNGYRDDFERMRKLLDYQPTRPEIAARLHGATYYPIFINWNAALGDSIVDDLFSIRFGQRAHPAVGIITAPLVLVSRVASSVFNAPVAWMHTINNYLDGRKDDESGTTDERLSPPQRVGDFANTAVWFVPRALTTPVVEAFGTPAWQVMKRRAQLAAAHRLPRNKCANEGAARTLLKAIQERLTLADSTGQEIESIWTSRGKRIRAEITMVGHSMGAIVLNRLLAAVHPLRINRVVYLAPAAGIDEFEAFMLPYLAHHSKTKFALFSLSRRHEAQESHYYVEPRGTLLAWIDNLFERGWTVGQMTHGRTTNVLTYYDLPADSGAIDDIWRKLEFKHGGGEPPVPIAQIEAYVARNVPGAPRQHGDFDEPAVLREVLCRVNRDAFEKGVCPSGPATMAAAPQPLPDSGW
jgi:pimeloyl-ACP methyl ester carboxylesterase